MALRIQIALTGVTEVGLGDVAHSGADFAEGEIALLAEEGAGGIEHGDDGAEVVGEEVFQAGSVGAGGDGLALAVEAPGAFEAGDGLAAEGVVFLQLAVAADFVGSAGRAFTLVGHYSIRPLSENGMVQPQNVHNIYEEEKLRKGMSLDT